MRIPKAWGVHEDDPPSWEQTMGPRKNRRVVKHALGTRLQVMPNLARIAETRWVLSVYSGSMVEELSQQLEAARCGSRLTLTVLLPTPVEPMTLLIDSG
jgi:hypothetical protein